MRLGDGDDAGASLYGGDMTPETNPFYAEVARLLKLLAKKKLDDATAHRCVRDLRKLLTLSSNSVIIYETGKLTHMRGDINKARQRKNLTMLGVAKQQ
jgi:hypothetical protein